MSDVDWAVLQLVLLIAILCVAALWISFTYWPVTRRAKARISRAELVHYIPQRHLSTHGPLVRLSPAPGKKWLFLYEGRTLPRFGAIVNHTRLGRRGGCRAVCLH
ncbi:hypothetical protein [Microlunatus sp. Y2014]|uniref:hypothetical protein n=1 Tax=Microlunatus sp. Y2014 TaxID=3418488 RepID=UPI003DA735D7